MKTQTFEIEINHPDSASIRGIQATSSAEQLIVVFDENVVLTNFAGELCCSWELPASMHNESMLEIHCHENYATIVEARGLNGLVVATDKPNWQMLLTREDYHCKQCTWPIGYFKQGGKVHLIHATQWNRLDFTELVSGKRVTEREIDGSSKKNYLDYFHSSLYVSPDEEHFVVNGWCWSPWDVLYSWNIEQFKLDFEPGGNCLDALDRNGYNWDRPCCFVDNATIAWGYNEREANEPGIPDEQGTELIFQDIHSKQVVRRMPFEFFDLSSEKEAYGRLWFDTSNRLFVCSSNRRNSAAPPVEQRGTSIVDGEGGELQNWTQVAQFVSVENQTIGFVSAGKIEVVKYGI